VTRYNRQDVLRILRIHARQLQAWERAGLIVPTDNYGFEDLVQLRKLRDLRATSLSAASIRAGITAMRAVSGMANPLLEAGAARKGSRLVFRYSGAMMEPIAKQFVFDFDGQQEVAKVECVKSSPVQKEAWISEVFVEAVHCEEATKIQEAIELYQSILRREPRHAPFYIARGWTPFEGEIFAEQPTGRIRFAATLPHVFDIRRKLHRGTIDLCGLPW